MVPVVGLERAAPAKPGQKSVRWTLFQPVGESLAFQMHPVRDVDGMQFSVRVQNHPQKLQTIFSLPNEEKPAFGGGKRRALREYARPVIEKPEQIAGKDF